MFHFRLGFAALVLFAAACTCGKTPIQPTDQCKDVANGQTDRTQPCTGNTDCSDHYTCRTVKGSSVQCCLFADRGCTTEADCCPGQTCPADKLKCYDNMLPCEKDADCGDKGDRVCQVWTDSYGTSSRCRLNPCSALGQCPAGQACFNGECMADLPCGGSCPAGSACVPSVSDNSNACQNYANPTGRPQAACPVSCNVGFIGAFKDSRNIWDTCVLPDVQCICAELPGLQSNDLGRFSAVAADPGKSIFASTYDGKYGDLVVYKFGLDGTRVAMDYVDGVPADGGILYGPSGARGGIVDPGPDVGRYTGIAVSNGAVFVSYYDVTNGDLKVAVRSAAGAWSNHRVDGLNADLGLYSSIAIDSDGKPGVSYFQRAGSATFTPSDCPAPVPTGPKGYITALKYAHATTVNPQSSTDWVVKTIACMSRPPPPCDGCTTICANPGAGPACFTAGTGCTGCDPNTQACILVGTASQCANKYNPSLLVDVPAGVGVFSSVAFIGKQAVIAYMLRNPATSTTLADGGVVTTPVDGDLYAVTVSDTNVPGAPVLIDAQGDTGFFPSVKIDPGSHAIAIGYHDFSSKSFKFYSAPQLQAGVTPEIIDNGADAAHPGEQAFVGTDSAIVFGPAAGQVYAVYQDATHGDLKLAKRGTSWQVMPSISTAGAVGFFADGVFSDGKIYATHAHLHAKLASGVPQVDNSLILEVVTPP